MKQTEQYGLNQWELPDPVRMDDFNADNAKIDGELSKLRQSISNLAFQVGQLSLFDYAERKTQPHPHAFLPVTYPMMTNHTPSGGVQKGSDRFTLSGKGAAGSISVMYLLPDYPPQGSRLRMWVHHKGGSVAPSVGQQPMTKTASFKDYSTLKESVTCTEYTLDFQPGETFVVRFDLDCGSDSSMEFHDYCLAFL